MAKKVDKRQLGSGIKAIFSNIDENKPTDQEAVVKQLSNTVAEIPVSEIEVNPNQPRVHFDPDALEELADSIRVHGLIQPVTVRRLSPNEYQLISGERRLRASKIAGLTMVPAYIRIVNDQEMLEMALVENIQRENLNAIEVAITFQRLKEECQLTDEKLADRVGKKRATITNYLRLLGLPPDIQKAVKNKDITMGHARVLAGIEDLGVQGVLFKQTLSEGLSVRKLEKLASDYHKPQKKQIAEPPLPLEYENVQQSLRAFFGTARVSIKLKDKGKGQIVIPFSSNEELNELIDRIDD